MRKKFQIVIAALLALVVFGTPPAALASAFASVDVTSTVPGTGATNLGKAEDAARSSGDTGVGVFGVVDDTGTGAAGDYAHINVNSAGHVKVQLEPTKVSTFVAQSGYITPAASATDFWDLFGNGTTTVEVLRIWINYKVSTQAAHNDFYLKRRTTANSGGTSASVNVCKINNTSATAQSTPRTYTANPTTGSSGNDINLLTSSGSQANTTNANLQLVIFDEHTFGGPIVLSGTSEGVVLNNNGSTVANSGTVSVGVLYRER